MNRFLSKVLKFNPGIFRELDKRKNGIYLFLIELIILFFIYEFLEDGEVKNYPSEWIQQEIMNSLIENKEKLPLKYWEFYGKTNKTRIKQLIINITTSNANNKNSNSLGNRKELTQIKNSRKTEYRLSDLIIDNWLKNLLVDFDYVKVNTTLCTYFNFHKNLKTIMIFKDFFCFLCKKVIKGFSLPIIENINNFDDPLEIISSICINCASQLGEKVNV